MPYYKKFSNNPMSTRADFQALVNDLVEPVVPIWKPKAQDLILMRGPQCSAWNPVPLRALPACLGISAVEWRRWQNRALEIGQKDIGPRDGPRASRLLGPDTGSLPAQRGNGRHCRHDHG